MMITSRANDPTGVLSLFEEYARLTGLASAALDRGEVEALDPILDAREVVISRASPALQSVTAPGADPLQVRRVESAARRLEEEDRSLQARIAALCEEVAAELASLEAASAATASYAAGPRGAALDLRR